MSLRIIRHVPSRVLWVVGLSLFAFVVHLLTAARQPTAWDSVHYVRGITDFDVVQYSPHAPGYYLYVVAGRIVHLLTPLSAYWSMLVVNSLAGALTSGVAYLFARRATSHRGGVVSAIVVMTMPLLWYYSSIVASNPFDALALILLAYLAYVARPRSHAGLWACVVLAIVGGFRPSSFIIFFPITLFVVIRSVRSVRALLVCGAAGAAVVALWMVPMVLEQPGGLGAIRAESNQLYEDSMNATSTLRGAQGAKENSLHALGVTFASALPLLPLIVFGLLPFRRIERDRSPYLPLLIAALPGFLEATFLHIGVPGYALTYLPAIAVGAIVGAFSFHTRRALFIVACILSIGAIGYQTQRFLVAPGILPNRVGAATGIWDDKHGAPYPQTWQYIKAMDRKTSSLRELRGHVDPDRDVLVFVVFNGGELYRYAGYQLPEFTIHYLDHGSDVDQARHHRHTRHVDDVVEIPEGGSAVLVVNNVPAELQASIDAGRAHAVTLPSGRIVYAVDPNQQIVGARFITGALPQI